MLRTVIAASALAAVLASCPNQCSGHGRCTEYDKCVCFKQQGLYSPYRYGFKGADCSQRTCPLGRAYDILSTSMPSISPIVFKSATGTSNPKLNAVFIPASQDKAYRDLRSDKKIVIQIMTVLDSTEIGTFTWRYEEDDFFQQEASIKDYVSATKGLAIKTDVASSGVYVYFDDTKGATPSFKTNRNEIAAGDVYEFTLSWNEADSFDGGDSNTAHQHIECSGRGTCDAESGKCSCLAGYTGEACQRTACPDNCSGHGSCQTQARFASDGLGAKAVAYNGYEKEQQYGCKCDKGYRGPSCAEIECPSGADIMGADGGNEGMDCSGRGTCDYSTGVCKCFRGFWGERCEGQTTLI